MRSLPIPTHDQIRAVWHSNQTDILNAQRRCAPILEIDALHAKQHNHIVAVNLIDCAKYYRHKARVLLAQSDAPGSDAERDGIRYEAQHNYELAERDLQKAYSLLNLPTQ